MRQERGLSLANLVQRAKLAGHSISKAYVSQVEVGVSDPTSDKLEAIAAGLGVPVTDLFHTRTSKLGQEGQETKASTLPIRLLRVVGPASCGGEVWTPAGDGDETHPVSLDAEGDVVVRVEGDSMSGHGIRHGDKVVVAKSDPASLRDGDGAVLDVAGAYAIKLLRVRGGQRWLEEHRAGHEPRRVEFPEARIIGRVVEVTSPWARR